MNGKQLLQRLQQFSGKATGRSSASSNTTNLDATLSVGYRVNSQRGTQFRIWATRAPREHLLNGYTVNERLLRDLNQAVRLIKMFPRETIFCISGVCLRNGLLQDRLHICV